MNSPAALSALERFAICLDGLVRAVASRISARVMTEALVRLICQRLRRTLGSVTALALQIQAGVLRLPAAVPRVSGVHSGRASSPGLGLPRRFGWLIPLVPYEAAGFASQLRHLLADPEMAALLAATPRMARLLRPLCRMLGIEPGLLLAPLAPLAVADVMDCVVVVEEAVPASVPVVVVTREVRSTRLPDTWLTFRS